MARKKKIVITNNEEIYKKFNMLHYSPEIILKNVKPIQVEKIVRNINKNFDSLTSERIGDYIIVRKHKPLNYQIYLR